MARIAFLGGGNMAQGMIRNLLEAGHDVAIFNRSIDKVRFLGEHGAALCKTPREAAALADVVISMVTDDTASRACWLGPDGALAAQWKPQAVGVESSTVSAAWMRELKTSGGDRDILDCPVAGRPNAAADGTLTVFAGGDAQSLDRIRDVIESYSRTIFHMGPSGSGIAFKLIYNSVGAIQIAALAEAMVTLDHLGIDLGQAAEAFSAGATGSANVTRAAPYMTGGAFTGSVQFSGDGRIKDLRYGKALAAEAAGSFDLGDAALEIFGHMVELGVSSRNDTEVANALRQWVKRAAPAA